MINLLLQSIAEYGLVFVFFCVLVEQAGLPILAYPMLMLAGTLAARGELHVIVLLVTAIVACILADSAWYYAGRHFGRRVLSLLCRISLSPDGCVRQTESIFSRWGAPSLMVAKFVPGFASVATALAGAMRIRRASFLAFDAVGAALWAGSALTLGWAFATAIEDAIEILGRFGKFGVALIALALSAYLFYKWWQRHQFNALLRMDRISVESLAELIGAGNAPIIIDARSELARKEGGIPGARTLANDDWPAELRSSPKDAPIVTYCACPNDASAALVARRLMQSGFRDVRPLAGGIDAWRSAGQALERRR